VPRRSFKDRFLTPQVARAIMSPLGIVLFGVGTAATILTGMPVLVAAGVGVLAWGGRVLAAVPRDGRAKIHAGSLADPWRSYVASAQESKARFDRIVADMAGGPLRDRLVDLAARLEDGIAESWRIARRGNEITNALGRLDTLQAQTELAQLRAQIGARPSGMHQATAAETQTLQSLEAQLQAADRLQTVATDARDHLRALDARLDELVARAVEVSVGAGDTTVLGHDVDALVTELEVLRVALDEANQAERSGPELPRPSASP
jgi:hypothetical protein